MSDQPSLLEQNEQNNHSPKRSKAPDPWRKELSNQVERAFNSLNTYGKGPEALGGIFLDFADALDGQKMVDIELAFKEWKKTKEAFPTPAEIVKLTQNFRTIRMQSIGAHIPKAWTQVIRNRDTDEVLAEFPHPRESLSQAEIATKYGGNVRVSMRQD